MSRILITSGPTRQHLDPVRYLTNSSSGRMGAAMAQAAITLGHDVLIVSGPVQVDYPGRAEVVPVISTEEMFAACLDVFPSCSGAIGVAAPCDYRPLVISETKIAKTGEPLQLELHETTDVIAHLGMHKRPDQWVVGFALETHDARFRALAKLEEKACDLVVLNRPEAMHSHTNSVELLAGNGDILLQATGPKQQVANQLLSIIDHQLIRPSS